MAAKKATPPAQVARLSSVPGGDGNGVKTVGRLDSWKDIAGYFQRDIRTVQLWEKKEAMPVHRHTHEGRSSVYAFPEELEEWLRGRRQLRDETLPLKMEPQPEGATPQRRLTGARWWIVAGVVLLAALALFARYRIRQMRGDAPLASRMLAVLPFRDLGSPNAPVQQDFLVDGLTEDLITDLGRSGQLAVMSSRSVMEFKGNQDQVDDIARRLHASLILDGTVARDGENVRVTAQLLDPARNRQLWAGSYSRSQKDVMELQDEIAAEIAGDITRTLTGVVAESPGGQRPVDPQVRVDYLTGHYLWEQRNEPEMRRAIGYFQHAVKLDPGYAPAWVGLADSYNLMAVWGQMPSAEAFPQARNAAQMALSLDPDSAEAYNSLAFETYRYEWDFARADQDFRRAIALNPNYAIAHQWYGEFLGDMRRFDQSIAELRRAKDLDPLSAMIASDLADGYFHAGRVPEARAELERILSLYPNFVPAHNYLASVCIVAGNPVCAARETRVYAQLSGDSLSPAMFRLHQEEAAGHRRQARADLARILQSRAALGLTHYQRAQLRLAAGDMQAGYAELEKAFHERSWWLVTLMVDPGFDSVRTQPRFIAFEKRVGLPVEAAPGR